MAKNRVILTGGGTGGHIYPALAVGQEILRYDPEAKILFVGSQQRLDRKILESSKIDYTLLSIKPFNRVSIAEKIWLFVNLPIVFIKALFVWFRFRPTMVIGFGGFASFPMVLLSVVFRCKNYLWEANAFPGLVTRKFFKYVHKVFCAFPSDKLAYKNSIASGVPNRFENLQVKNKVIQNPIKILVVGGSQGARYVNKICLELWNNIAQNTSVIPCDNIEVLHQSGSLDEKIVKKAFSELPKNFLCTPYIEDMANKLGEADIVISRAGAGALSDICTFGKASILIPLPTAADNHQVKNAQFLQDKGASVMVEQNDLTWKVLENKLQMLFSDVEKIQRMGNRAREIVPNNITANLVKELFI